MASFLRELREVHGGAVALEARHGSWFGREPDALLREHRVARVAADPPRGEGDGLPGGDNFLVYFRLHGTPELYRSAYRESTLQVWAERIEAAAPRAEEVWCIFDNTASGAAIGDALTLRDLLRQG